MASICECLIILFLLLLSLHEGFTSTSQVYIIYLGSKIHDDHKLTSNHHLRILANVFSSDKDAKRSILYHYKHSFSGFSAILNSTQASTLAKNKEVISVFKSKTLEPHTTRSWDFLGLSLFPNNYNNNNTQPLQLKYGHDIIVGVIDTGIWPESASFREAEGMERIPSCWRGKCEKGTLFSPRLHCNNKLIGARFYPKAFEARFGPITNTSYEYRSPRDFLGHGTHVASIAVGSVVEDVSFKGEGLGKGVARGGAPMARLAVYKACWGVPDGQGQTCPEADILKAFDDALRDGVHVISVSIGSTPPFRDLFNWSASIGSLHAQQLGVTTVFSAGNAGPQLHTVSNVMPWAICVATSTIDRSFPTNIVVDDNFSVVGQSFSYVGKSTRARLALADDYFDGGVCRKESASAANNDNDHLPMVLLCFSVREDTQVFEAVLAAKHINASGLIFAEPIPKPEDVPEDPDLSVIRLDISQALRLRKYARDRSLSRIIITIGPTQSVNGRSVAPAVSYFSSRGPSTVDPDILKPDMVAPGFNILGAWAGNEYEWMFQSGASMACPHVAGAVALLKSAHPSWLAAAIKSALMTTASSGEEIVTDDTNKRANALDMGAGQVEPVRAMDPGLVYDMDTGDYVQFLCNQGYTEQQIKMMMMIVPCCCKCDGDATTSNINYPAISVSNLMGVSGVTVRRTARNVGPWKAAVYVLSRVVEPRGVEVAVWPRVLVFWWWREEVSYTVTLRPKKWLEEGRYGFGEIVWRNALGPHLVRTPLLVSTAPSSTTLLNSTLCPL